MYFLGLALALVMGLALGTLGGGGSTLTVPIFVYVLGFEAKRAIVMSFPVVGAASVAGAVTHWRHGHVRWRTAFTFGVVAMVTAYLSAHYLAPRVTGGFQLGLLGAVMVAAAISMFRSAARERRGLEAKSRPGWLLLPIGAAVGVLTGLVGIGGGFLIVPALVLFAAVPMKEAVGTSLVVIALNTLAGFAGGATTVSIPWGFVTLFAGIAVLGIVAGGFVVKAATPQQLKRAFAVFLVVVGAFILIQNRAAFLAPAGP